jgi:hypothetical protein
MCRLAENWPTEGWHRGHHRAVPACFAARHFGRPLSAPGERRQCIARDLNGLLYGGWSARPQLGVHRAAQPMSGGDEPLKALGTRSQPPPKRRRTIPSLCALLLKDPPLLRVPRLSAAYSRIWRCFRHVRQTHDTTPPIYGVCRDPAPRSACSWPMSVPRPFAPEPTLSGGGPPAKLWLISNR